MLAKANTLRLVIRLTSTMSNLSWADGQLHEG